MCQGEVKQKSCGTLQLTYALEQLDQIYTLTCNGQGDIVKLSKATGRITVFEIVVTGIFIPGTIYTYFGIQPSSNIPIKTSQKLLKRGSNTMELQYTHLPRATMIENLQWKIPWK